MRNATMPSFVSSPLAPTVPPVPGRPASGRFCSGLDVGDRKTDFEVVDHDGAVLGRGKIETTRDAFTALAARYPGAEALLETCGHAAWISATLEAAGWKVTVATADVLCGPRRRKNDRRDAAALAELLRQRARQITPVYQRPEVARLDLALITARDAAVNARTKLINVVRGVVKQFGDRLKACSTAAFGTAAKTALRAEFKPALAPLLTVIRALTTAIRDYDRQIDRRVEHTYVAARRLAEVPGVGSLTALAFVLVMWDRARFTHCREAGAYLGLVPHQQASGDRNPQLGISRTGHPLLRRLLVQCAHYILGPFGKDCDLRRYGQRLIARGGKAAIKRAAVAVARKLAVQLLALWKSGAAYDPDYALKKTA